MLSCSPVRFLRQTCILRGTRTTCASALRHQNVDGLDRIPSPGTGQQELFILVRDNWTHVPLSLIVPQHQVW